MRKLVLLLTIALTCLLAEIAPGVYKGSWSGGASGDFKMTLSQGGDGEWKAEVVFTAGGEEVKTRMKSVKVDGNKVNVIYRYNLQGAELESNVVGELKGNTFEGTYKATTADGADVDEGTWKASAQS